MVLARREHGSVQIMRDNEFTDAEGASSVGQRTVPAHSSKRCNTWREEKPVTQSKRALTAIEAIYA